MASELVKHDAEALVELLKPACERIEIVGSIRRGDRNARDIDLLAIPLLEPAAGQLFDAELVPSIEGRIETLIRTPAARLMRPRDAKNGPRQKQLRFRGRNVDLWLVRPPATWGVLSIIRTGPAEFSHLLVGAECHGGAMPVDFRCNAGRLMRGPEEIPTPEEADVFRALDLPTLPPHRRTVENLRRLIENRNSFKA